MHERSDLNRLAYYGFLPFMTAFFTLVGLGYYHTFMLMEKGTYQVFIYLQVVIALIIIFTLVRVAATLHIIDKRWSFRFVFCLVVLFCLSGYGVFSTLMLYVEGATIIRSSIAEARNSLASLETVAKLSVSQLPVETHVEQMKTYRDQLEKEIGGDNKAKFCGIGNGAGDIIDKIKLIFAEYHKYNGYDHGIKCSDKALVSDYKHMYIDALDSWLSKSSDVVAKKELDMWLIGLQS